MRQRLSDLDARVTLRLRVAERPGLLRSLAILFAHSGDSWFWLLGLALVWWLGPDFWKARAMVMAVCILVGAVIVMAIKFTVRRQRPAGEWGGIYRRTDPHSFPSGHAARAALLAVLGLGMGPAWFGLLLLVWAPLVILARVAMGVHYLTDVLAGALFGVVMGFAALSLIQRFAIPV
ncbi:MAG: phosphatase PAP2 family protein [Anaerolineales bacterium]|nr:phosphatase PAP2 family protein [Anaerolineales bacterium]